MPPLRPPLGAAEGGDVHLPPLPLGQVERAEVTAERRLFSAEEHAVLLARANGQCQLCWATLGAHWQADHIIPWHAGGITTIANGRAVCRPCNAKDGRRGWTGNRRPEIDLQVREIPVPIHRAAKARAAAQGWSLRAVLEAALRAYARGEWTPTDRWMPKEQEKRP